MNIAIISGSAGLIGSECVDFFSSKNFKCVGIDNNLRETFFGKDGSTLWNVRRLQESNPGYEHHSIDIRNKQAVNEVFDKYQKDIKIIIHTAAQPSHDWAAKDPFMDFTVNANGTLALLEATRKYCPEAVFIFTSTNKVYGDRPNLLPILELESRWELPTNHENYNGIGEDMSIDQCLHSLFGASKVAADVLVQEYGKYFGMKTGVFRGGCLTGPKHSGAKLHGFLSYLVKCAVSGETYNILGYKGKQVRDNIHSYDLVNMFWHFYNNPKKGEVYNAGGSRHSNCSVLEAIDICENLTQKKMKTQYVEKNRIGDHVWYISDVSKFLSHYPDWEYNFSLNDIVQEIIEHFERV